MTSTRHDVVGTTKQPQIHLLLKSHQVSIVIITEKSLLSEYEKISLTHALDLFSPFNKYLVVPETTDPEKYTNTANLTIIRLHDSHFESVATYSKLLLSDTFYQQFYDSEFILIYQLDVALPFTPILIYFYHSIM